MFTTTCCASGYPEPVISINGIDEQVTFGNHASGLYKGCASRNIMASGVTPGSNITTFCNVSLTQSVTCTTVGAASKMVPRQAVKNCNAALTASVLVSSATLIAGK